MFDEQEEDDEHDWGWIQKVLDDQRLRMEEADYEDDLMACASIIAYGLEEARRIRAERRSATRLYLVRPDLLPNPRLGTPWQVLFGGQQDRAFITTMGFDVATFSQILNAGFTEMWDTSAIPRADVNPHAAPRLSRRSLDAQGALGLILHFLNSTIADVSLCQIFALIPTTVSRYISFSLKALLAVLRQMPDARISWPSGDEFIENMVLITQRHPLLDGAFGSIDGLNLPVQTSRDQETENATFNGWLQEHFVKSVYAFGAGGEIIACKVNAPGSWHDSRAARQIYEKLRSKTPEGFYLVADTAFPRGSNQIAGRIRAPVKQGDILPQDPIRRQEFELFNRQLLSYRQTAEWGMRSMQGTFGRLRVPLSVNYDEARSDLLEVCARLFNLRVRAMSRNQTTTVYRQVWDAEEVLWLSFESMLFSEQRANDRVRAFHMIFD